MHQSIVHRAVVTFTQYAGDRQCTGCEGGVHANPLAADRPQGASARALSVVTSGQACRETPVDGDSEARPNPAAQCMPDVDLGEVCDGDESSLPPLIDRRQPRACSRPSGASGREPGKRGPCA